MPEIDPYAELYWRAEALREVREIERVARRMARRLGLEFRLHPIKVRVFVEAVR
jgi:hypothetical protein